MLRVTREVCCASTDPNELIAMLHELHTRGCWNRAWSTTLWPDDDLEYRERGEDDAIRDYFRRTSGIRLACVITPGVSSDGDHAVYTLRGYPTHTGLPEHWVGVPEFMSALPGYNND